MNEKTEMMADMVKNLAVLLTGISIIKATTMYSLS